MKILVVFPGKIGDAMFATASIRHLATKNPGAEIHWVYGTPMLTEFVTKCLANTDLPVAKYIPYECPYTYGEIYGWQWGMIDWKDKFPGYDAYYNLSVTKFPEPGCHLIEWIARGGGLIQRGEHLPNPHFTFKEPPRHQAGDLILVHPWIPAPERQHKWMMYLNPEYKGCKAATVGLPEEPLVPKTKDLRGIDYDTYIDYLRTAKLVVGLCSSSAALAAAFGTPTIMVHNIDITVAAGGAARFGQGSIDLRRPFIYDIDRSINALLSLQVANH
jgi:hypothetical protein